MLILGALAVLTLAALAQRGRFRSPFGSGDEAVMAAREADFHFIRLQYTDFAAIFKLLADVEKVRCLGGGPLRRGIGLARVCS